VRQILELKREVSPIGFGSQSQCSVVQGWLMTIKQLLFLENHTCLQHTVSEHHLSTTYSPRVELLIKINIIYYPRLKAYTCLDNIPSRTVDSKSAGVTAACNASSPKLQKPFNFYFVVNPLLAKFRKTNTVQITSHMGVYHLTTSNLHFIFSLCCR
jgi:hypothetical protein